MSGGLILGVITISLLLGVTLGVAEYMSPYVFGQYLGAPMVSTVTLGVAEYMSPYKQNMQGTSPEDTMCNYDLILVIKNNGNPACVKEESIDRLLQTGWADRVVEKAQPEKKSDTWFEQKRHDESGTAGLPGGYISSMAPSIEEKLGLAVGGAQDINNFRNNIENGYLPLHTDITYEGLFYDYYFDTGSANEPCDSLFCPSYSYAVSRDPFSNNDEYYLSVGLNSGLEESDFERKNLNLVIVLDISGSMGGAIDRYYYDRVEDHGLDEYPVIETRIKMDVAKESLVGILDQLNPEDNLGIVLFNEEAHLSKPLESIKYTDRERFAENIMGISAQGSTNMEAGIKLGTSLFDEIEGMNSNEYENRIIFLTDAMPNSGDYSKDGLFGIFARNSENRINTTFIGIGVDMHTNMIEELTKIKGANYYSVHSADEFKTRLVDEFDFMVTPLVFNLLLELDADGYSIKKVYGSPEADQATGEVMRVNTLFPSDTKDGMTRGGMVLLKLEKTSDDAELILKTSYEDVDGNVNSNQVQASIGPEDADYYENTGIQKGILLSRYAEFMKTWIFEEREKIAGHEVDALTSYYESGIHVPSSVTPYQLGEWERQSAPLHVSAPHKEMISVFTEYFATEAETIGDDSLWQELEILKILSDF